MNNTILFLNGYIGFGSPPAGKPYWCKNEAFARKACHLFQATNVMMPALSFHFLSNPTQRYEQGVKWAQSADFTGSVYVIVTHSMGAAFGEGVLNVLVEQGKEVNHIIHIEPFQAALLHRQAHLQSVDTIDYQLRDDPVLWLSPTAAPGDISFAHHVLRTSSGVRNPFIKHRMPLDRAPIAFWSVITGLLMKG